jgi:hypothetical protein
MTALTDHQSTQVTKLLLIGDSGSGKTGALASLAEAGFNLRILDFDNGLDVLSNILRTRPAGALERVEFETLTDPMRNVSGRLVPRSATVWQRTAKLLDNWSIANGASRDLGPVTTWGPQDVLVIDSLTMLSNAAMNLVLSMNARLGQQPHQSDWYVGQQMIEGLLQMLYDEGVGCNVIVISHITYIGDDNGPVHGYPNTLGKALPPKVGRYFNSILQARTTGMGTTAKRQILTNTQGFVELKNTAPTRVPATLPLETGLADYFKAVRAPKVEGATT